MNFAELAENAQNHYATQFERFVLNQRRVHQSGVAEIKLQVGDETGLYGGYYCADFYTAGKSGEFLEFSSTQPFKCPATIFQWKEAPLRISDLHWNNVRIEHERPYIDMLQFQEWFSRWFDLEGHNETANGAFSNAIHSVSVEAHRLTVDFGSAPAAALTQLLDILAKDGAELRILAPS